MALFMQSMYMVNDKFATFGATLVIEMHENKTDNNDKVSDNYFIRIFYDNEIKVNTGIPHSILLNNCQKLQDCPLNQYINSTKHLLYDDFDKECNKSSQSNFVNESCTLMQNIIC